MKRKVFFSFHFGNDVFRVQQIRNMGALEGNEPISVTAWEDVKRGGENAIKKWIDETMKNCECVIVLIGSETANRPWVRYEISKAWNEGKGLLGIYIHNLKDPQKGKSIKGANPFDYVTFPDGTKLSTKVKCYETSSDNAYKDIEDNISQIVEIAIQGRITR